MEHRAQTILYTVLMEERYGEFDLQMTITGCSPLLILGVDVPAGLLYYTPTDEVIQVPASLRGNSEPYCSSQ